MIDDLLEISRITRGKLELRKIRVPLADIIERAIETARPAIDQARHRLNVELPDEELEMEGDPHRLSQVLSNLLCNAAKFTPDGGKIQLTLERQGDEALSRYGIQGSASLRRCRTRSSTCSRKQPIGWTGARRAWAWAFRLRRRSRKCTEVRSRFTAKARADRR